uniref:Uncharacterized protein n=1 Tax=Cacopsylla melanoneura TaxID=428564 RepID=A0A8D8V0Z8_9HEMI
MYLHDLFDLHQGSATFSHRVRQAFSQLNSRAQPISKKFGAKAGRGSFYPRGRGRGGRLKGRMRFLLEKSVKCPETRSNIVLKGHFHAPKTTFEGSKLSKIVSTVLLIAPQATTTTTTTET